LALDGRDAANEPLDAGDAVRRDVLVLDSGAAQHDASDSQRRLTCGGSERGTGLVCANVTSQLLSGAPILRSSAP